VKGSIFFLVATSAFAVACGASYAAPAEHLADAQSAERSAAELGAANLPKAQLHLQLAHEQIVAANAAIKNGDNEAADRLLARAKSDAELSIALTRAESAKTGALKASTQSSEQHITNVNQGAAQ
jgi:Domain of unknown function (DUF4398)